MGEIKITNSETSFYPLIIQDEEYTKLFAFQTEPEKQFWFKNEKVSEQELIEILIQANIENDTKNESFLIKRETLWFCPKDIIKASEIEKYFTKEAISQLVEYGYLTKVNND